MTDPIDARLREAVATLVARAPAAPDFPTPAPSRRPSRRSLGALVTLTVAVAAAAVLILTPGDDPSQVTAGQNAATESTQENSPTTSTLATTDSGTEASTIDPSTVVVVLTSSDSSCEPDGLATSIRDLGVAAVTVLDTTGAYARTAVYAAVGHEADAAQIAQLFDPVPMVEPLAAPGTTPTIPIPEPGQPEPTIVVVIGAGCDEGAADGRRP